MYAWYRTLNVNKTETLLSKIRFIRFLCASNIFGMHALHTGLIVDLYHWVWNEKK